MRLAVPSGMPDLGVTAGSGRLDRARDAGPADGSSRYHVSCLWCDLLSSPDRALAAADFLSAVAGECGATRVFDVGAGTGRTALALAERGQHVTAAEPSRGMRIALLARLADRPDLQPRVTVLDAPALATRPARPVGLVYLGGVLPHVPAGDRPALFRHLAGQLSPNGRRVLDMVATGLPTVTGPALLGERQLGGHVVRATRAVTAVDGTRFTARFSYQVLQGAQLLSEEVADSDRETPPARGRTARAVGRRSRDRARARGLRRTVPAGLGHAHPGGASGVITGGAVRPYGPGAPEKWLCPVRADTGRYGSRYLTNMRVACRCAEIA